MLLALDLPPEVRDNLAYLIALFSGAIWLVSKVTRSWMAFTGTPSSTSSAACGGGRAGGTPSSIPAFAASRLIMFRTYRSDSGPLVSVHNRRPPAPEPGCLGTQEYGRNL